MKTDTTRGSVKSFNKRLAEKNLPPKAVLDEEIQHTHYEEAVFCLRALLMANHVSVPTMRAAVELGRTILHAKASHG